MFEELEPYFMKMGNILLTYSSDDKVMNETKKLFHHIRMYFFQNIYDHTYDVVCPCKPECKF